MLVVAAGRAGPPGVQEQPAVLGAYGPVREGGLAGEEVDADPGERVMRRRRGEVTLTAPL